MHGAHRAIVVEQENLVGAHAEDLSGDVLRRIGHQVHGQRCNLIGLHPLHALDPFAFGIGFAGNGADEPAPGKRRNAVGAHVGPGHVERNRFGQTDNAHLGGGIVGLSEVADQARRGRHVNERPAALLPEVIGGRARHEKAAVQMDINDRLPFLDVHLEEHAVTQDAGIVDDAIDAAEEIDRRLDDVVGRLPGRHVIGVGQCFTTGGTNFIDNLLGGASVLPFATG